MSSSVKMDLIGPGVDEHFVEHLVGTIPRYILDDSAPTRSSSVNTGPVPSGISSNRWWASATDPFPRQRLRTPRQRSRLLGTRIGQMPVRHLVEHLVCESESRSSNHDSGCIRPPKLLWWWGENVTDGGSWWLSRRRSASGLDWRRWLARSCSWGDVEHKGVFDSCVGGRKSTFERWLMVVMAVTAVVAQPVNFLRNGVLWDDHENEMNATVHSDFILETFSRFPAAADGGDTVVCGGVLRESRDGGE